MVLEAVQTGALAVQFFELLLNFGHDILCSRFLEDQSFVQNLRLLLLEVFKVLPQGLNVRLEALGELLSVLLCVAHNLLRCLLELNAAVVDHTSCRVNSLHNTVNYGRVNLVVVLLQVLAVNALQAQVVIGELVVGYDELFRVLLALLVVAQGRWLLVEELVDGVASVVLFVNVGLVKDKHGAVLNS